MAVMVCMAFALSLSAQVQTTTDTEHGQASKEVKVERAEVVYVNGNDLMLKMEDGTMRHFPNVSESARATVDGKEIGIHDVKVGMKLQKTITTTTTPKLITTVQSVTGKVWHINPPRSVILTLEDGTNQQFNIPKDQKFSVDGQMVDAWGLKKGMKVSATKVVEEPVTSVSVKNELSGSMPPPPPPAADTPILIAVVAPTRAPAAQVEEASAALPKTGSSLPLIGLLGALALVSSLGLGTLRRIA
jgi:LPXTG-motif cell wall-anchored protein